MNSFFQFATNCPGTAVVLFALCLLAIYSLLGLIISYGAKLVNRVIRHRNIKAHGWPPAHCDADGDLVEGKEKDEE